MRARVLIPVALLAVGGWGLWGWYWGDFLGPVSEAEARGHFDRIVDAAQRKDFDALCRLAVPTCRAELQVVCPENFGPNLTFPKGEELERVCRESVPPDPPAVVSSRHHPEKDGHVGGRILVVRGVDGRGKPYETEVLIFRNGRGYLATHAVFWSGDKFEEGNSAEGEPGD